MLSILLVLFLITRYEKLALKCLNIQNPKTLSFKFVLLLQLRNRERNKKHVEVPDLFR